MKRWLLWAPGSLLVMLLGAVWLARDREPTSLDEHARRALPGKFIALSQGYTNYEIAGPASGPVVLLVPGISIPRTVFDRTLTPLAEAGYRVIAFDLYGRGFSDRPRVRYDAALFNRQIDDLLAALGIDGPVSLIGLASGGLQSLLYAEQRPTRVASLVLIAPDGVDAPVSGFVRMLQFPVAGDITGRLVMNAVGQRRWEERLQNYSSDARLVDAVVRQFRGQLEYKGFWRGAGILHRQPSDQRVERGLSTNRATGYADAGPLGRERRDQPRSSRSGRAKTHAVSQVCRDSGGAPAALRTA